MPRYKVDFDLDARNDLASFQDYIAVERGDEFAKGFVSQIIAHCESFRTIPHRGTLLDSILPGLRMVGWRKTVTVIFRVFDTKKRVLILGVLYRGRDVFAELKKRSGKYRP